MRFLQVAVRDPDYPRNSEIRDRLRRRGHTVSYEMIDPSGSYLLRCIRLLRTARSRTGVDCVILSELGIQYFWVSWIVARSHGAMHWVDWFVGMYETNISDWRERSPRSVKALVYRFFDRGAVASADFLTTDTEPRSAMISSRRHSAFVLPVGAPAWAKPMESTPVRERSPVKLLFYGQVSPLHGIEQILKAFKILDDHHDAFEADLIMSGSLAHDARAQFAEAGIPTVRVHEAVPAEELSRWVHECDIVLGVFGDSNKAATVIPNKVWQALLSGKPVVTRASAAYAPYRAQARPLLLETAGPDHGVQLAEAVCRFANDFPTQVVRERAANQLRASFDSQFDLVIDAVEAKCYGDT